MLNNIPTKFFTLALLVGGLLACQTVPQTAPAPDSEVMQDADAKTKTGELQADPQQTLYQQAMESARRGETELAIQQFTQLISENPSAKKAYSNLGLLYLQKQDNKAAKEAFLNAIAQDKNDAIAYNHLAVIQRQQGDFTQALFHYYKAISADPDYANAHLNLGILLDIYMQELPKALEQYEIFQRLTGNSNEKVEKWILDIKRRIDTQQGK